MTYNGTALALYVNGVLTATKVASGLPRLDNPSAPIYVGGRTTSTTNLPAPTATINGLVAPAKVYDRALTASEILQDLALGR